MAISVDVRVSAEELIRATSERYTEIIATLVRENAMLSASLEQVTARLSEAEVQVAALGGGSEEPSPEVQDS